jgi:hypothetical protein
MAPKKKPPHLALSLPQIVKEWVNPVKRTHERIAAFIPTVPPE